jgi:hypothetical protein
VNEGNRITRGRWASCLSASYEIYRIRACPVTQAIGMRDDVKSGLRVELDFVGNHINGHVQR